MHRLVFLAQLSVRLALAFAFVLATLGILAIGAAAQTATVTATTGQSCAGTRFGSNLNCTSNDFTASLIFDQPSGSAISSCQAGETVIVDIIATVQSNSPDRYDIGFFLGENGINPDLNNPASSCSIGLFPTSPSPFNSIGDADTCGNFLSNGNATLLINDAVVKCLPVAGTTSLALPYVMSFDNNPSGNSCNVSNIKPGTTAKCIKATTSSVTGVTVNGYIRLTKQTLPDTEPGSFAFTTAVSPAATVTPSTASLVDGGIQNFQVPLVAGGTRTLTLTETALGGWDPTASISCTTPSGGSAAGYVTVNNASRSITASLTAANFGAYCTITNTKKPTVAVQKITTGYFGGPFSFSQTNLNATPGDITTATVATAHPPAPTFHEVTSTGSTVTITEGVHPDFTIVSASCIDANSARTGNTGFRGSLSGDVLTIAAADMGPGSVYTCTFTNAASATRMSIGKSWVFETPSGDVNSNGLADVGDSIVYTYVVTNTGNVPLANVVVADVHEGTALQTSPTRVVTNETLLSSGPVGTSTDAATNGSWDLLTPNSQIRFRYTHSVALGEFDAG